MSRTYKATGINLKSTPLGENDRLVTILTREHGLVRAVAAGSRKLQSKLGGRSEPFVVNELLIAKGRSLDKITQAETLESYPGLGQDLKKLTAGQYLAELTLYQAFSDQAQEELFSLLNQHLSQIEDSPSALVFGYLTDAIFQFLTSAGVAPQVHTCCITQQPMIPVLSDRNWRVGFSAAVGGVASLAALERLAKEESSPMPKVVSQEVDQSTPKTVLRSQNSSTLKERDNSVRLRGELKSNSTRQQSVGLTIQINALELFLLQQLALPEPPNMAAVLAELCQRLNQQFSPEQVWLPIERILRRYTEYHFERPIRSAVLIDSCFTPDPIVL
jgi:DNA repair protein RecO (recombination protein O)